MNRDGVIVSISFGSQRIMEVRSRTFPHDVTRLLLPPGSMFLLGPWTNANFTHSILPWEDETHVSTARDTTTTMATGNGGIQCKINEGGRISLTLRDVRTFYDFKTQQLFGQGSVTNTTVIATNEDGSIHEESMIAAMDNVRQKDMKDKS